MYVLVGDFWGGIGHYVVVVGFLSGFRVGFFSFSFACRVCTGV